MEEFLTSGDIARLLGVSGARVRFMAKQGVLPPEMTRIAGKRVFRREDVERWLRKRQRVGRRRVESA